VGLNILIWQVVTTLPAIFLFGGTNVMLWYIINIENPILPGTKKLNQKEVLDYLVRSTDQIKVQCKFPSTSTINLPDDIESIRRFMELSDEDKHKYAYLSTYSSIDTDEKFDTIESIEMLSYCTSFGEFGRDIVQKMIDDGELPSYLASVVNVVDLVIDNFDCTSSPFGIFDVSNISLNDDEDEDEDEEYEEDYAEDYDEYDDEPEEDEPEDDDEEDEPEDEPELAPNEGFWEV